MKVFVYLVPYAFYLVYIGGDHFEYRQFDILLPFLALAVAAGVVFAVNHTARPWLKAAILYAACVLIGVVSMTIPWLGEKSMPHRYQVASVPRVNYARYQFLQSIPGYSAYLDHYNEIYTDLTQHLGAIRAEEHRFFLAKVTDQAEILNHYLTSGVIDSNAIISLMAIGAIPYYTDMRTIDYNGLTDTHIARVEPGLDNPLGRRLIAHERQADWDYLVQRNVDYIFSVGFGFFTRGYPLPLTRADSYIVKLPHFYFSFRTTNSREEILERFGDYPVQYHSPRGYVVNLN